MGCLLSALVCWCSVAYLCNRQACPLAGGDYSDDTPNACVTPPWTGLALGHQLTTWPLTSYRTEFGDCFEPWQKLFLGKPIVCCFPNTGFPVCPLVCRSPD